MILMNVGGSRSDDYINQMSGLWGGQGPNNLVNVGMGNQTIGMSTTAQSNWSSPTQDHQAMYLQNDSMEKTQNNIVLNYIKNHLLNDNQVASYNEPTNSLPEHHENRSFVATGDDVHGLNSGYQMLNNYAEDVVPNYGMTYAQPITTWIDPQDTNDQFSTTNYATVGGGYPTQDVNQEAESVWKTRN